MSQVLDRLLRMANLKRKNPDDYSFDESFEINQLSLANVNAMQQMARSEGWELVGNMIVNEYNKSQKVISQLAFDPEKNSAQLITHAAISETLKKIYKTIYKTIDTKKTLERTKKNLLQFKRSI